MKKLRTIFCLLIAIVPNRMKIFLYNKVLGADIAKSAKIGLSYIDVKKIVIGENAKIGNFNIIRNLELFQVGANALILNSNYFSAAPLGSSKHFSHEKDRFPAFILGEYSTVSKKNFFDCNNTISIGKFSAIAGLNSQFFTHGINLENCIQETDKIYIENYCRIATCSVVIKGSVLPEGSTLAANSTLHKAFTDKYMLYSGVPAKPIRQFDPSWQYFHRKKGFVD